MNRLLFMGLTTTTRMGEKFIASAFMGLNVKFRSDFEFELKMEMKLITFFLLYGEVFS